MIKTKNIPYLYTQISRDEQILWAGKPNKKCMVLEAIFNVLLPFALIWGLVDMSFIVPLIPGIMRGEDTSMLGFYIMFFSIHLLPVWIYLYGVLSVGLNYKNTEYIITNKAIYESSGVLKRKVRVKRFQQISDISIHRGLIDKRLNLGDVECTDPNDFYYTKSGKKYNKIVIQDIPDYNIVFNILIENNANSKNNEFYNAQKNLMQNNTDYDSYDNYNDNYPYNDEQ